MKKILSIVSGNPSGSLNIAVDISRYLKSKGYEVIDIFRKYNNTGLKGFVVVKDRCTLDYIVSLGKLIRREKPDLIIVHGYSTHIWTKLALVYSGINAKLIHVEHNTEKYTPFRRYLTRKMDKYTDRYICVSKGVADHLKKQGVDESKVCVVYNGIDIEKFNLEKKEHDVFTIGMVARFSRQKDQMTLIKAVEYLAKEEDENLKLILMGVGKTKKYAQSYIENNNLSQFIEIVEGSFLDISSKIDVFVLATHYEGLPLVLCEAMASRIPIIATDVPGVDEIIVNDKTGLLVEENNVQDLVNKIEMLKCDDLLSERLINSGWKYVNLKFNLNDMYRNYENVIREVNRGE